MAWRDDIKADLLKKIANIFSAANLFGDEKEFALVEDLDHEDSAIRFNVYSSDWFVAHPKDRETWTPLYKVRIDVTVMEEVK